MSNELKGLMVALITPFTEDGTQIDAEAFTDLINRQIEAGVHGLVVNGSTGEFASMSVEERKEAVEISVRAAAGRVPVVAGTSGLTTKEAIELTEHAARAGADAVIVVPPFYDAPNLDELKDFLTAVWEAGQLPIMYYNLPGVSGVQLSPSELASLGNIPGVKYIKDTSGDGPGLTELLVKYSDAITTFNGWDTLTFFGLASGAKGAVWGAVNIFPDLAVELWETLAVKQDLAAGRALWAKIWPICEYLDHFNYAASVKAGARLTGAKTGPVRAPFHDLTEAESETLAGLLRDAGVALAVPSAL
ncbi:dihydrodipicolinate synthase family protein [Sinomonas terrae]|uniref:Dihydrodipicolinate synthase family protein n=1 Tax=Sinomonas terrae TaxID=2908838 RepID=A0ABS9U6X2_9MICC|nr:dihydrodipicolinate synthase family protein [Sinomonas terrae]MCH6472449.1 dihydrodipicolinate synthase family protein [Sinomonas terrae]